MTTALVPVDNAAVIQALDPRDREIAVTRMLTEARDWLAHAKEATEPASIATFKAQMATVAEATKQLGLSKDIQLDAQEMVRRAERGVGVAIRLGQENGTVLRSHDRNSNFNRWSGRHVQGESSKTSPTDFATKDQLSGSGERPGMYALADGITNEQFESGIARAKEQGNLSRANVVREVKGQNDAARLTRQQRADLITDLAAQGYSSRQMPARVGVTEETVRDIARDFGIDIHADKIVGRTRRLDHTHMVESTVTALDNLVSAINLIDFAEVDNTGAAEWATSLTTSIAALKRFQNKIKEIAQ